MSQRNDETFTKFMVQLAQKMVDRDDHNLAATEEARNNLQTLHNLNMPAMLKAVYASGYATGVGPVTGPTPPLPLFTHSAFEDIITNGELELIRAYFRGEDVVATLLAQER